MYELAIKFTISDLELVVSYTALYIAYRDLFMVIYCIIPCMQVFILVNFFFVGVLSCEIGRLPMQFYIELKFNNINGYLYLTVVSASINLNCFFRCVVVYVA